MEGWRDNDSASEGPRAPAAPSRRGSPPPPGGGRCWVAGAAERLQFRGPPPPPAEGHTLSYIADCSLQGAGSGDSASEEEAGRHHRGTPGLLLLHGGRGLDGGIRGEVWALDLGQRPGRAEWHQLPCAGAAPCRFGHAAAALGPALWLLGGFCPGAEQPSPALTVLRCPDGGQWRWEELPADPGGPCAGHTIAPDPAAGLLWAFGGDGGAGALRGDLRAYSTDAHEWVEKLPSPAGGCGPGATPPARAGHAAVLCPPSLLSLHTTTAGTPTPEPALVICGGTVERGEGTVERGEGGAPQCAADIWAYGVRSGRWQQLWCGGDDPGPRTGHTAAVLPSAGVLVSSGGIGPEGLPLCGAHALDLASLTWRQLALPSGPPLSPRLRQAAARCRHACAALPLPGRSVLGAVVSGGCGRGRRESGPEPAPGCVLLSDVTVVAVEHLGPRPPPPAAPGGRRASATPPPGRSTSAPPPRRRPRPPRPRVQQRLRPPPGPRPFTAMSCLGRLFGSTPPPDRLADLRHMTLLPRDTELSVARLRAPPRRPVPPEPAPWPKLTPEEQADMMGRLYEDAAAARKQKLVTLRRKWYPRQPCEDHRMPRAHLDVITSRLYPKPGEVRGPRLPPRRKPPDHSAPLREWEESMVRRLHGDALSHKSVIMVSAFRKHTPVRQPPTRPPGEIEEIVDRLVKDKGEARRDAGARMLVGGILSKAGAALVKEKGEGAQESPLFAQPLQQQPQQLPSPVPPQEEPLFSPRAPAAVPSGKRVQRDADLMVFDSIDEVGSTLVSPDGGSKRGAKLGGGAYTPVSEAHRTAMASARDLAAAARRGSVPK